VECTIRIIGLGGWTPLAMDRFDSDA